MSEYSEMLNVDVDALDVEWVEFPNRFHKLSEKFIQARQRADKLKAKIDVVYAQIAKRVRANPPKYGIDKMSEGAINSVATLDDEYQKTNEDYINAKYEQDILSSAVDSMDHKRRSLEHVVKLLLMNYFSGPTVPRDLSEEMLKRKADDRMKDKIRSTLNKGGEVARRRRD